MVALERTFLFLPNSLGWATAGPPFLLMANGWRGVVSLVSLSGETELLSLVSRRRAAFFVPRGSGSLVLLSFPPEVDFPLSFLSFQINTLFLFLFHRTITRQNWPGFSRPLPPPSHGHEENRRFPGHELFFFFSFSPGADGHGDFP